MLIEIDFQMQKVNFDEKCIFLKIWFVDWITTKMTTLYICTCIHKWGKQCFCPIHTVCWEIRLPVRCQIDQMLLKSKKIVERWTNLMKRSQKRRYIFVYRDVIKNAIRRQHSNSLYQIDLNKKNYIFVTLLHLSIK